MYENNFSGIKNLQIKLQEASTFYGSSQKRW